MEMETNNEIQCIYRKEELLWGKGALGSKDVKTLNRTVFYVVVF